MFELDLGPQDVLELTRNLAREAALRAVGFPDRRTRAPREAPSCGSRRARQYRVLHDYLTDCGVFKRSRAIVWIDPQLDLELLERLQPALRAKIVARGITIEVNPTSNLLIGDFGDLSRHPLWRLRPPLRTNDAPDLSICIGSDDPSVFASNLREEYQWLEDAMRMAGVSDEEARCWLLRTRACGLETRFTLPAPRTPLRLEFAPRGDMPNAPLQVGSGPEFEDTDDPSRMDLPRRRDADTHLQRRWLNLRSCWIRGAFRRVVFGARRAADEGGIRGCFAASQEQLRRWTTSIYNCSAVSTSACNGARC